MESFNIPVVLFIFRRQESIRPIMETLRSVKPAKVYLLSDEGRTPSEIAEVRETRKLAESEIDWDCQIVKNYANSNRGVLQNIGLGAKWVFEREDTAIFLEDDNLPEPSFFPFCQEMLAKYRDDERVLWVCGTNYLEPADQVEYGSDYFFSQHMLPCGWASWARKFSSRYDGMLRLYDEKGALGEFEASYQDKRLFKQQMRSLSNTRFRIEQDIHSASWDYQMLFTLRVFHMYGIVPVKNQIRNIGADVFSEHHGNSMKLEMTKRFCENNTYPISFPLRDPKYFATPFEKNLGDVILEPLANRIKRFVGKILKRLMGINENESLTQMLRKRR